MVLVLMMWFWVCVWIMVKLAANKKVRSLQHKGAVSVSAVSVGSVSVEAVSVGGVSGCG